MITRKASFRLPAVIICFAGVLGMVSCVGPQPEAPSTPEPWTNPCTDERTVVKHAGDEKPIEEYTIEVMDKYSASLFTPYPHFQTVFAGVPLGRNANGEEIVGIEVGVTEITNPSTLPEERRIPDCLEGVPVKIVKQKRAVLTEGR